MGGRTTSVVAGGPVEGAGIGTPARGSVRRARILARIAEAPSGSVVVVQAPAGYGKTTLLSQIAHETAGSTAVVHLDREHNDPVRLLETLEGSLRAAGVMQDVERRPGRPRVGRRLPALLARLDQGMRAVLLLDEAEALVRTDARDVIGQLAVELPASLTLVVSSRSDIGLPLATLRPSGRVVEVSVADLALSGEEVEELARRLGIEGRADLVGLVGARMDGWPVGVYLMLLAVARGEVTDRRDIRGDDVHIMDYLEAEVLGDLPPRRRSFLSRSSVLDELTGPSCDWILARVRSQVVLEELADANLLITRRDHSGGGFRLHAILREYLHERLKRTDAELHERLHLRASEWFERSDRPTLAVHHAMEVGNEDRVAELVQRHGQQLFDGGLVATVSGWLEWFDHDDRRSHHPGIALMAAMASAAQGDEVVAARWKAVVDGFRGDLGPLEPLACFLYALTEAKDVESMLADARCAVRGLGPESSWHPAAVALEGLALFAGDDQDGAEERLLYAGEAGQRYESLTAATFSFAMCSLLASSRGDYARGGELATRARDVLDGTDLDRHATSVLSLVAAARSQLRRGEPGVARHTLNQAYGAMPRLTPRLPAISALTLVEMAAVAIELADVAGARQVLSEARRVMEGWSLGAIEDHYRDLVEVVDALPGGHAGVSTLTPAELRLLPYLATHLSFPEIGERLFISRHTVKTQAMAIYRKLEASTRSEAVTTARGVGLLPSHDF